MSHHHLKWAVAAALVAALLVLANVIIEQNREALDGSSRAQPSFYGH